MNPILRMATVALALTVAGCASRDAGRTAGHLKPDTSVVVPVTVGELRDRVARSGARATLVNVWATWCAPCREEFPALLRVAASRSRDGVRLVLVSTDFPDQMPAIRGFLAAHGVTDTTYLKTGDDMTFINALNPSWTGALPATFIYGPDGRLANFWEGRADSMRFENALNEVLASHPPTEVARP